MIILLDMIILIYKKSRSLRVQIFVDTWSSMCNLKICRDFHHLVRDHGLYRVRRNNLPFRQIIPAEIHALYRAFFRAELGGK